MVESLKDLSRERPARSDSIASASPRRMRSRTPAKHFRDFLDAGAHGDMDWLAARPERRADPRGLWAGRAFGHHARRQLRARSKIRWRYLEQRTRGAISVYAQGDDYHDLIKKRLKALARWLVATEGGEVKVFVDTAAVMEKPLAQAAGLGWQGKHTNLVSREFGSWLFLGAIFTTLDLPRDERRHRPLRLLPGLPRHLPDVGVSRRPTGSMRGAAFPISPSRTRARSRANFAKPSATASMAATIASRSAPGTSSRRPGARPSSPRATSCARPRSPNWRGSTTRRFARCSRNRRSSASAATASSAMC